MSYTLELYEPIYWLQSETYSVDLYVTKYISFIFFRYLECVDYNTLCEKELHKWFCYVQIYEMPSSLII